MGFGHRVYKSYDPRAKIIKRIADEVFEVTGRNPLLDIAIELERIALEDEYFVTRKLYPNVDFYSGLIYQAMGFPKDFFPVLFAIPRTGRLVRPVGRDVARSRAENLEAASDLCRSEEPGVRAQGHEIDPWFQVPSSGFQVPGSWFRRCCIAVAACCACARPEAQSPKPNAQSPTSFDGGRAYEHLRQVVELRPASGGLSCAGSDARIHHRAAQSGRRRRRPAVVRREDANRRDSDGESHRDHPGLAQRSDCHRAATTTPSCSGSSGSSAQTTADRAPRF